MFTGLVQGLAEVVENKRLSSMARLALRFPKTFKKVVLGESIAINGCCLTVVRNTKNILFFDVSDETLAKTNLGELRPGARVNFERALKAGDPLGGHFVLGHVDGVGKILKVAPGEGSLKIDFSIPKQLNRLVIDKGSIALDGISLTVSCKPSGVFRVHIIPHTARMTNIQSWKRGDGVNIEVDMLGKYVARLFQRR